MKLKYEVQGNTLLVHLPAELDHYKSENLCCQIDQIAQSRNIRWMLLDFSHTVFMDSSGIGLIIGRYKTMRFLGGMVAAVHVNQSLQRLMTISGIYRVIDVYENLPSEFISI